MSTRNRMAVRKRAFWRWLRRIKEDFLEEVALDPPTHTYAHTRAHIQIQMLIAKGTTIAYAHKLTCAVRPTGVCTHGH